jgi:shikimate kinase
VNVALIGLRACGKSTVGRLLAERMGWSFVDVDERIVEQAGRSIRQIFDEQGEAVFRDLEQRILADILRQDRKVIAVGGGACERPANREAIRSASRCIWLTGSPPTLLRRMADDPRTADMRPKLLPQGGLQEIVELLARREPIYHEMAERVVDTEHRQPEDVVSEIEAWLRGVVGHVESANGAG